MPVKFTLCCDCYNKGKFPNVYLMADFKKQTIFTLLELKAESEKKKKRKGEKWSLERIGQVLKELKENRFNILKAMEKLEEKDQVLFVKNFLRIPFDYFRNFNRLTTKNFEIIFKKNQKKKKKKVAQSPLIKDVAFLKMILRGQGLPGSNYPT